ncbi:PREDICTED: zinc finger protein ZAT9-like [Camelina sativa]|uniref:Zinc finger protein ZAT9-like n=1 Tax=Camelina sativa TaxID=90675 RepID=A0ABM0Z9L4_CAMSA|nr:PREDICTED: zinc finger protein ZAT9-like [Camelina sativa]
MENYKCRYCFKSFANGRALGGHMRSHMPSLHVDDEQEKPSQLSYETTESDVSSSSAKEKRNGNDDPKFASTSSLLLLEDDDDDESETESSRNVINLTRKRSKRTRKLDSFATKKKKVKTSQLGYKESDPEPPHSSASDTTTEEDLAFCLMMLSRDKWKKNKSSSNNKEVVKEIETDEDESEGYNNRLSKMNRTTTTKGRYKCETCGKVFKSYQALGGHRASHKKNRVSNKTEQQRNETEHDNVVVSVVAASAEKRIHECPICFRVFASGQALGGHKRSHGIGNLSVNHHHHHQHQALESVKQRMIDLNLPAPTEEDEVSVVFQ